MKINWKIIAKWIWWLLVIIFIGGFLKDNLEKTHAVFIQLPSANIILSLCFLVLGKFLLVAMMYQALKRCKVSLSIKRCFEIYNLTQLAKYIPGSIWQFVSRIGLYKEAGLSNAKIRDSILLETFWVVASAFLIGFLIVWATQYELISLLAEKIPVNLKILLVGLFLMSALILIAGSWRDKLLSYAVKLVYTPSSLVISGLIWFSLGVAFWITLLPFAEIQGKMLYVIGLYALSYGVGFVVPFAPAGLGIREAVLVIGMMPYMQTETAIILAAINRLLYIFSEIVLAGMAIIKPLSHEKVKNLL